MYRCWWRFEFSTVLRLCTGANVSWDGALAFIPADYVSSEQVRCNVPSLAMTRRLGTKSFLAERARCGTWPYKSDQDSAFVVFQWSLLNRRSGEVIIRRDLYYLILNPAELSAGIVHSCRGHMMTNRSLTAYLAAKKNTGYLMQAGA